MALVRVRTAPRSRSWRRSARRLALALLTWRPRWLEGVLLKPVAVVERTKAWDEILKIVERPKWEGPEPEPSEGETMQMVVDEIMRMRRDYEDRS